MDRTTDRLGSTCSQDTHDDEVGELKVLKDGPTYWSRGKTFGMGRVFCSKRTNNI